jgi:hypothetical protein
VGGKVNSNVQLNRDSGNTCQNCKLSHKVRRKTLTVTPFLLCLIPLVCLFVWFNVRQHNNGHIDVVDPVGKPFILVVNGLPRRQRIIFELYVMQTVTVTTAKVTPCSLTRFLLPAQIRLIHKLFKIGILLLRGSRTSGICGPSIKWSMRYQTWSAVMRHRSLARILCRVENDISTVAVPTGCRSKCLIAAEMWDTFFHTGA